MTPEARSKPGVGDGVTEDGILGGRVRLRQPAAGYRVGIDPVFLAAAAPNMGAGRALDLGSGVGAAALCLAWRQPQLSVIGLEIQPTLACLGAENALLNGLGARVRSLAGDLLRPPPDVAAGEFDLVMANPPFHAAGEASVPLEPSRALGHVEGEADLATWIERSLAFASAKGAILMIHKPERLAEILAALEGRAGGIVVFPLWPGAGKTASRIILRAQKGNTAPMRLASGLVLHETGGRYTAEAERILREGQALAL